MNNIQAHDDNRQIPLSDEQQVKELLVNSVFNLWDVVNNLTRLRPTKREHYSVSIFGSARAEAGTHVYEEVKRLATALSAMGCNIITGGGPGLMQAANEGSLAAGKEGSARSMGIRIALPFEQNANKYVEEEHEHRTFFTRLHHFVLASDAFIVTPGGIGTVLELLMVWQLLQVKHLQPMPLVLVGKMYAELVEWAKKSMTTGAFALASPQDMNIPQCVDTVEEAVAIIQDHRSRWLKEQKADSK